MILHIYISIYIGGKQFRKHVSCFYAQGGNVGVLSLK